MKKRRFVVAANWKMHKSPREAADFFASFLNKDKALSRENDVVFFVPAVDLHVASKALEGAGIGWGAQNCHYELKGAFTGENSAQVLAEMGATHVLIGHSERRALFHETDEEVAQKVKTAQSLGLVPMLCVGESLAEREAGKTSQVIVRQVKLGLAQALEDKAFMLAYEPVWAIGTGKVATPAQANDAHLTLRKVVLDLFGPDISQDVPILYGGSVKPDNAAELARQNEVDGFLVGGASLEPESFLALCRVRKI